MLPTAHQASPACSEGWLFQLHCPQNRDKSCSRISKNIVQRRGNFLQFVLLLSFGCIFNSKLLSFYCFAPFDFPTRSLGVRRVAMVRHEDSNIADHLCQKHVTLIEVVGDRSDRNTDALCQVTLKGTSWLGWAQPACSSHWSIHALN